MDPQIRVALPVGYQTAGVTNGVDWSAQPMIMEDKPVLGRYVKAALSAVGVVAVLGCAALTFGGEAQQPASSKLYINPAATARGIRTSPVAATGMSRGVPRTGKTAFSGLPTAQAAVVPPATARSSVVARAGDAGTMKQVLIGVAADSGCGKSTFMRRLTGIFGGAAKPLGGGFGNGGWETNTLVSDKTCVLCLDDYHLNDRQGRKKTGLTALDERENNFDLMFEQMKTLKSGESISKPIYNHVNGTLDKPETIEPTRITIIEGLHPMLDDRVAGLLDFSVYLDISDDVKFAWKIQRDMEERGWDLETIKASIEARKPDFEKYVAPQRAKADIVIQVLLSTLVDDPNGKILKVRLLQKKDNPNFKPVYLIEEGAKIEWSPCGKALQCGEGPGIKLAQYEEEFYGEKVAVIEMDGQINNLEEAEVISKYLFNTGARTEAEIGDNMRAAAGSPGFNDGTGLFQTIVSLKLREVYEKLTGETV